MTFNNLLYRPKFSFVTSSFGNKIYDICASRLIENVRYYVTSNIHCLTDDNLHIEIDELFLKILKKYKVDIKAFDFTSHRSSFIWKPWLILSQLKKLSQNGILFYLDSGSEISTNRHSLFELNRLIKFASEKGSIFFRNNIDSTKLADSESLNILNYYIGDIGHATNQKFALADLYPASIYTIKIANKFKDANPQLFEAIKKVSEETKKTLSPDSKPKKENEIV
jgi:hypothetical protein